MECTIHKQLPSKVGHYQKWYCMHYIQTNALYNYLFFVLSRKITKMGALAWFRKLLSKRYPQEYLVLSHSVGIFPSHCSQYRWQKQPTNHHLLVGHPPVVRVICDFTPGIEPLLQLPSAEHIYNTIGRMDSRGTVDQPSQLYFSRTHSKLQMIECRREKSSVAIE